MAVGLLGLVAVISRAQGFPQLIEESRPSANRGIGRKDAVRFAGRGCDPMDGIHFFVVLPTRSLLCPMILLKLAEGTRLLFYDETSRPKSEFTESLYIRFVNDFKDDYSCHLIFPVIFFLTSLWTRRATDPSLPGNGGRRELNRR